LPLLEVKNLVKHYPGKTAFTGSSREKVRAVDGVSFSLEQGETLGLVGESGCGKSTLGRLIVRLEEPTAGQIFFAGEELSRISGKELRERRRRLQIIFQDSLASLNPRRTVGALLEEPLENFGVTAKQRQKRVQELLELVGLEAEQQRLYPHEFSGGQRQRINIARALALKPSLVVCDEPVSSLDASIRAQILNLLRELQKKFALSYIFISHDLAAVIYLADLVAVMYLGKIVELLPAGILLSRAVHPYTQALLQAVPQPDPRQRGGFQQAVQGEPPDPAHPPEGCRFHPRCPAACDSCRKEEPALKEVGAEHLAACHLT